MQKDVIDAFIRSREALEAKRPVDRMMSRLKSVPGGGGAGDGEEDPSKKKFDTPDTVPPKPDGNKPTIRRPRGPSM